MRFSFLGLDIFFKIKKKEDPLTLQDINFGNNKMIEYLRNLSLDEIDKRIKKVTCNVTENDENIKRVLSNYGIVIIPDYIPHSKIDKISNDLKTIKEKISTFRLSGKSFEEKKNILYQQENFKIKRYSELANYNKAVVNIRKGQDKGMIDIFNIDKWFHSFRDELRQYFNQNILIKVIKEYNNSIKATNLNLYMNKGVSKTRGFHVDGYKKQLKGFVYLEDCLDLKCGPYTYVTESHLDFVSQKINKLVSTVLPNSTETPFIFPQNIVPALAKKGTLVISDQSGSHRGFPQDEECERIIAVMNFA